MVVEKKFIVLLCSDKERSLTHFHVTHAVVIQPYETILITKICIFSTSVSINSLDKKFMEEEMKMANKCTKIC